MTEQEAFDEIDIAIHSFKQNEGLHKRMKLSKDPHSDWLVFNYRQLTWKENGIEYLIEIYPNFNKQENISSWTMYTAAHYDNTGKRYYLKKNFAQDTPLGFIADNMSRLIADAYSFITSVKKEEIPFSSNLRSL